MKETFLEYIIRLYQNVPAIVYVGLAIVFLIGAVLMFVLYGRNQGLRYSCRILCVDYLACFVQPCFLESTVIGGDMIFSLSGAMTRMTCCMRIL